jgi:hypothetical protein
LITQSSHNTTWAKRFMSAAIVQGAIAFGLTVFLVFGPAYFKPGGSGVMAAADARSWLSFGYMMYIIVGILGIAASSILYRYLERILGKQNLGGIRRTLAWLHLVLMNAGTAATMGLLVYMGYFGTGAMLPIEVGGRGLDGGQAHQLVAPFMEPLSAATLVIIAGVIAGAIGFLATFKLPSPTNAPEARMKEDGAA